DLTRWVEADRAVRDTQVARLEEQITLLRHQLWESELRAGMAEADAGEAQMRAQRLAERQQRVRALADLFTPEEGEVLLTPDGDVRVRLTGLKFASGSHWLNPKYDPLLDKVAQVARTFPQARLTVEGHTDDAGSRATNQTLSLERARRVAAALAGRLEVPEDSLQVVGVGPDRPVAPNSTAEGRARNRRIEFLWETGEETEATPAPAADSP
ncbi:MAG TPA: OmpA family protein, partial [Candidatus Krumholzibacteria bacterium]|nr:OmpA family protein [Candidatus Krumholzibacteria bacterium]